MEKATSQKRIYLQILDLISDSIIKKELKVGDRLPPERHWAEELGVSRATVREAIRALEMFGLVSCRQGEGNFVSDNLKTALTQPLSLLFWLHDGDDMDIHDFRQALEIQAVQLAAKRATDEDVEELRQIEEAMMAEKDNQKAADLDKQFHDTIGRISRNCLISNTMGSAAGLMELVIREARTAILEREQDMDVINFQHHQILEAIEARDSQLAAKRMLEHMMYIEDFFGELKDKEQR
jgi:GntR family transcriptional repressor for pyruvate dehydrogenase complex